MSSIMRRRRGLKSAISILLSEGWAPTPTSSQPGGDLRHLATHAATAASFNLSCVLGSVLESMLLTDPSKNLFQQTARLGERSFSDAALDRLFLGFGPSPLASSFSFLKLRFGYRSYIRGIG